MTSQVHEQIILNGEGLTMAFCPPLPENSEYVVPVDRDEAEKLNKDKKISRMIFSTACWRQYIATWEIKDDRFYLNDIVGKFKKKSDSPILANWFTGVIRIPKGEVLVGVNMGFGSVFEKEIHIKVENGVVVKQIEIDNTDKEFDRDKLAMGNLPGSENRFDGDDL